jgi:hypothetical protein
MHHFDLRSICFDLIVSFQIHKELYFDLFLLGIFFSIKWQIKISISYLKKIISSCCRWTCKIRLNVKYTLGCTCSENMIQYALLEKSVVRFASSAVVVPTTYHIDHMKLCHLKTADRYILLAHILLLLISYHTSFWLAFSSAAFTCLWNLKHGQLL